MSTIDPEAQNPDRLSPIAAQRLANNIASKDCICAENEMPNKEHPFIKCSIYGAPDRNELFVKLESRSVSFVEAIPSALIHPPMADRILGMDVLDAECAFSLT